MSKENDNEEQPYTLADSIKKHGVLEPIVVTKYGIADGAERKFIADDLGKPCPERFVEVKNLQEHIKLMMQLNFARDNSKERNELRVHKAVELIEKNAPGFFVTGKMISEALTMPYRTVMRYLPEKYKDKTMQKVRTVATVATDKVKCPICERKMDAQKLKKFLLDLKETNEEAALTFINLFQLPLEICR